MDARIENALMRGWRNTKRTDRENTKRAAKIGREHR